MRAVAGRDGVSRGFALVEALLARFWPDIRSNDEDDAQGRLSPLAGLNGIGGEGALIQPIRMVALLPGSPYGTNAQWHLLRLQREPGGAVARDFNDARTASDPASMRELAARAGDAKRAYAALVATLDARCGADAPPCSNIRNALDEVVDSYRTVLGIDAEAEAAADPAAPDGAAAPAPAAAVPAVPAAGGRGSTRTARTASWSCCASPTSSGGRSRIRRCPTPSRRWWRAGA